MTVGQGARDLVAHALRPLWVLRYAHLLWRSPYDATFLNSWIEGWASWDMNQDERGNDPMPRPADALYEDQQHWGLEA